MKIIFTTVFSLLMFLSSFVLAQPYQKYDPLKGSTLVSTIGTSTMVELNYRDQISQMIFTVKENSKEKGLAVDLISEDGKRPFYMSNNAVKNAVTMDYQSVDSLLDDRTIAWISQKVYKQLEKKGESKVSTDGGKNWVVLKRKYYNYDFPVKTKAEMRNDISYMYCETDDGAVKFWIQTGGNPLILKMDLGWATMTLKEFKMAGE